MAQGVSVYAGFWRRFAALLIDLLLMLPVYLLMRNLGLGTYVADLVNLVLITVAYTLFLASRWQATPGMRLMRVMGVDVQHERLALPRIVGWCALSVALILVVLAPMLSVLPTAETDEINKKVIEAKFAGKDPLSVFDGYTSEQVTAYAEHNERLRKRMPITLLLGFAWIATIVVGKQKAGIHNTLVGVRFVKGRAA